MHFTCLIINACIFHSLQDGKYPPPLPQMPPAGGIGAGGFVDPAHSAPPPGTGQQSYNDWLGEDPKKQVHSQPPPPAGFNPEAFPDLPAVPNSTLPDPGNSVGGSSAGGEDVDFDDLTRRFEQLKKRKWSDIVKEFTVDIILFLSVKFV